MSRRLELQTKLEELLGLLHAREEKPRRMAYTAAGRNSLCLLPRISLFFPSFQVLGRAVFLFQAPKQRFPSPLRL